MGLGKLINEDTEITLLSTSQPDGTNYIEQSYDNIHFYVANNLTGMLAFPALIIALGIYQKVKNSYLFSYFRNRDSWKI